MSQCNEAAELNHRAGSMRERVMVWLYERYQFTVFPAKNRVRFVEQYLPSEQGTSLLDIGCGPAVYTQFLSFDQYVGVDLDASAIKRARSEWHAKSNVQFVVGSADEINGISEVVSRAPYDVIFAHGLLHHLDRVQVVKTLRLCHDLLKPEGTLVAADPCFFEGQHPISRLVTSWDRGKYVRSRLDHEALIQEVFPAYNSKLDDTLLIFPFDLLVVRAQKVDQS